jgi:vacuolar-type H+-ATPase subunit D/Vma8
VGRLEEAIRALGHRRRRAYGALPLEARLQRLEEDVREVKTRVNGLIFVVLGAVIAQLVLRVVG